MAQASAWNFYLCNCNGLRLGERQLEYVLMLDLRPSCISRCYNCLSHLFCVRSLLPTLKLTVTRQLTAELHRKIFKALTRLDRFGNLNCFCPRSVSQDYNKFFTTLMHHSIGYLLHSALNGTCHLLPTLALV